MNKTVVIGSVETRSGEKNGKRWTRYGAKDGNGTLLGSTFDGALGRRLQEYQTSGVPVQVELEQDGDYWNIVGAEESVDQQAEVAPAVDWDAKERRDYRSRAWAQALGFYSDLWPLDADREPPDAPDVFPRIRELQRLIYADVVRDLDPTLTEGEAEETLDRSPRATETRTSSAGSPSVNGRDDLLGKTSDLIRKYAEARDVTTEEVSPIIREHCEQKYGKLSRASMDDSELAKLCADLESMIEAEGVPF